MTATAGWENLYMMVRWAAGALAMAWTCIGLAADPDARARLMAGQRWVNSHLGQRRGVRGA
jgi:hypothetical protein